MTFLKPLILVISLSLTACVQKVYIQKTDPVAPPDYLLRVCTAPALTGSTVAEALKYTVELRSTLEKCNVDKYGLQKWKDALEGKVEKIEDKDKQKELDSLLKSK